MEKHYGEPQDTEWAFDPDGDLWLLQARPITTLHAGPPPGEVLLHGFGIHGAFSFALGAVGLLVS